MARRSAARHARRLRRITPRRWLPFVALLALVVGAVFVERDQDDPVAVAAAVAAPSASMPVAAVPGALSTAWYCSGGSARGEDGPAELSVVIANVSATGTRAQVTAYGSDGKRVRREIQVPANGRTRVVAADLVTADWASLTVEVLGGRAGVEREVKGPRGVDASPCSSTAAGQWLIPSGSTAIGATEDLFLFNPFPDATSVDISFATTEGNKAPRSLQGLLVPARSLRVVPSADLPARLPAIATKVTARTGRVVVDRLQTYDGKGDVVEGATDQADTAAPQGIASTAAIPAPATRWFFPDAVNDEGTRTQLALYNPTGRQARLEVVIAYEDPGRQTAIDPIEVDVRAREQQIVDLTKTGGIETGVPYTIDVRSLDDVPIAAEQLRFGASAPAAPAVEDGAGEEQDPDAEEAPTAEPVRGFAVLAGSPLAARSWLLPSRGASKAQVATVVVANPGLATVTVRVAAYAQGSRTAVADATVRIPGGDRRTIELGDPAANPALVVTASGPVVVGHAAVVRAGLGISASLGSPFPATVSELPPAG
ncbi:hypothetical protein BH10ACT1_BH10ACT1_41220 [soil metagenome]